MSSGIGDTRGPETTVDYRVTDETEPGMAWARTGYRVVAWIFLACIAIQVFLAGMAVFGSAANWGMHTGFVHVFELLPLIMVPLAFLGRLPTGLRWHPLAVFVLIGLQYALAQAGTPVAALHPVNALLIFWIALGMARGSSAKRPAVAAG